MNIHLSSRPEQEFQQHSQSSLLNQPCQSVPGPQALCVLGTDWSGDVPTPRQLSRMQHALNLLADCDIPTCLIAAGGIEGTGGELCTEAQRIGNWFEERGLPRIYREEFSRESVGNIIFTALGLFIPIGARTAKFVTDECHAPRVDKLASHILKGVVPTSVSASPWPLTRAEFLAEHEKERRGEDFIERLISEVDSGDLIGAFDWIVDNHKSNPYLGWRVDEIVAITRGQLRDYGVVLHNAPHSPTNATSAARGELPIAA